MQLHVHSNSLQKWRDKILADIASLLEYKLPIGDLFSRNKLEALVFVLERSIVFLEQYGKADMTFLNSLKLKLNSYQNLLFIIKQYLNSNVENTSCRIIKTKIFNPHLSAEELENLVGFSHTTVSHYIHIFQQKYYPLISQPCK